MAEQAALHVQAFAKDFAQSGDESLDRFIEHHPSSDYYAKLCLAKLLVIAESRALASNALTTDWYAYVFRQWVRPLLGGSPHKCTFITFNYDRTIEAAFATMCSVVFNMPLSTARNVLAKIGIEHVYGSLGNELCPNDSQRRFHTSTSGPAMHEAAKGFRLIPQERSEDRLAAIRSRLWRASRIVCLGFAYDRVNMHRIGIDVSYPEWADCKASVAGTAYGLSDVAKRAAVRQAGRDIEFGGKEDRCLPFIENHIDPPL